MFLEVVPLQVTAEPGEIGQELALIAGVAAAMQLFLAPTLHAQVEALQASKLVPSKFGGIAAIVLGAIYGLAVGTLAYVKTDQGWYLVLVGLLGGIVAGGGAVIADQRIDGLIANKAAGSASDGAALANVNPPPESQSAESPPTEPDAGAGVSGPLVTDGISNQPSTNGAGALAESASSGSGPH